MHPNLMVLFLNLTSMNRDSKIFSSILFKSSRVE